MTDEQINHRIAEACGWSEILNPTSPPEFKRRPTGILGNSDRKQIPNYCADLNAMAEAEMTLTSVQLLDYIAMLYNVCDDAPLASSRQRAQAFLRALNKWEEVQG